MSSAEEAKSDEKRAAIESEYERLFGAFTKNDAIKHADTANFSLFSMYQPVKLIYSTNMGR